MEYITNTLGNLVHQTAFFNLTWGNYIMIAVACVFLYLAIKHGFEPLLLVPIAFGMLLVNIYPDIMLHAEDAANGTGGLLVLLLSAGRVVHPSFTDLPGCWCDDRLRSAHRKPEEFPAWCSSSVRYFRSLSSVLWLLDSMTKQQQLSPSSVELTARHPSSLQVSCSRQL